MKIFPTFSIKELDKYTIEHEPISSIDLMERAAKALVQAFVEQFPDSNVPIVIFAGPGNNGGDALAVARLLPEGYHPIVYLFNPKGELSPDCRTNRDRLLEMTDRPLTEVTSQFTPPMLTEHTVVIDGLFGSGLTRPLQGGFAAVVRYINASPATVVAIDVPSGLMGEDNAHNDLQNIVKADFTLSLQLPKLAFFFADNASFVGHWRLLDIGLSQEAIEQMDTDCYFTESEEMRRLLKPRNQFAHKGEFGKGLLIAGSQGMAGASILAAKAALRSGIGLLTLHTPYYNNIILQTAVPEAMTELDYNDHRFTESTDTDAYAAVAVGPGLGQAADTEQALLEQIDNTVVPMVIDADALNLLAKNPAYLTRIPKGSILTPHVGELERLVGKCANGFERLQRARHLAAKSGAVVVLKGAYTAVCLPDGHVYFNPTGNPGMATGGSGDVLSGVLLALLAQGYPVADAARLGVYLHGLAGDLAAAEVGEMSLVASDLIAYLPKAITSLS